jgi:RNA polymerase-binding protein DksA
MDLIRVAVETAKRYNQLRCKCRPWWRHSCALIAEPRDFIESKRGYYLFFAVFLSAITHYCGGHTMATKKKLNKKELEHFKNKLLAEKQRVLEEMGELQSSNLKQSISDQSGEVSRYSYHLGDTASLSYGREFSMGLAERQQKYLEQVDDALGRIEDGTYGICKVTGELIPLERLEEVPVAKYSVKGKEIMERRKRGLA